MLNIPRTSSLPSFPIRRSVSTQSVNKPLSKMLPADDIKLSYLPQASLKATSRQVKILQELVELIEQHAQGLQDEVLSNPKYSLKGMTEAIALMDPIIVKYLQKPKNINQQVEKFIKNMSPEEIDLIYAILVKIELGTGKRAFQDNILSRIMSENKIDLSVGESITNYYLKKKQKPEAHALPEVNYPSYFMKSDGLRPNERKRPIRPTTEHLAYHGSAALILKAIRRLKFPEEHARRQPKFDAMMLSDREAVLNVAMPKKGSILDFCPFFQSSKKRSEVPEYMPKLPKEAFQSIKSQLPKGAMPFPALVKIPLKNGTIIETQASVIKHPITGCCLAEFIDHTQEPHQIYYSVSQDKPLIGSKSDKFIGLFDNPKEALECLSRK